MLDDHGFGALKFWVHFFLNGQHASSACENSFLTDFGQQNSDGNAILFRRQEHFDKV